MPPFPLQPKRQSIFVAQDTEPSVVVHYHLRLETAPFAAPTLQAIPKVWMQMAESRGILLYESPVTSTILSLLVFPVTVKHCHGRHDAEQAGSANVDAVSHGVLWTELVSIQTIDHTRE
jgi:hypothetical protein